MTGIALVSLLASAALLSGRDNPPLRYDPGSEVTVNGNLAEVRDVADPPELKGIHLLIRCENGKHVVVYVAPKQFLRELGIAFPQGTLVEVRGSKVAFLGESIILARTIRWDDTKFLTLRYEDGRPFWQDSASTGVPAPTQNPRR